jgi:hypothetical protein
MHYDTMTAPWVPHGLSHEPAVGVGGGRRGIHVPYPPKKCVDAIQPIVEGLLVRRHTVKAHCISHHREGKLRTRVLACGNCIL